MRSLRSSISPRVALLLLSAGVLLGCRQDMHDTPRYEAYEASDLFPDGMANRHPVPGTVARGEPLELDDPFLTGKSGGAHVTQLPVRLDLPLLRRGRQRYDIYCSPCHDHLGQGAGMVVQRGFRVPPSFHLARLRDAADGYYFEVITNGFGAMYSYAYAITPQDRWAIVAYIRALQLSQDARIGDVPADQRAALGGGQR